MSLLLQRLGRSEEIDEPKAIFAGRRESTGGEDEYQQLKLEIHRRIVDEMDLAQQRQLTSGE